jgi:hypothetical protein
VLVGVVQLSQQPERVSPDVNFVVVRLTPLDLGSCGIGDALYLSSLDGTLKYLRRVADWELESMFQLGIRRSTLSHHELIDQVIEARAELVDDLTGDNRETQWRVWPSYAQYGLSRIVIRLMDRAVEVLVLPQPVGNLRVEILDLLIGPLNLDPNTVEWMHDVYLQRGYQGING